LLRGGVDPSDMRWAVAAGAGAVWFQLRVIDDAAAGRVRAAGLDFVGNRCPAIEWPRLFPAR
jgi:uncharacterized protein